MSSGTLQEASPPPFRHLVILHYHWRPGGVRRVVGNALSFLMAVLPELQSLTLVAGEEPESGWREEVCRQGPKGRTHFVAEPAVAYVSESKISPKERRGRIGAALEKLLLGKEATETLLWSHNMGLGRNLILSEEIGRWAELRKVGLVTQHHDFWFENRWERWPEFRRSGYRSLAQVAAAVFGGPGMMVVINRDDQRLIERHLAGRVDWCPNLVRAFKAPSRQRMRELRRGLAETLGDDGPLWLLPTRFLRRKNVAEAILLTRWLRPEAWMVMTAGVSSAAEMPYARRLMAAARRGRWRVRFGILNGPDSFPATVDEIIATVEVMLLSSVQEGFGLPFLEAAAAGKPLIARKVPKVHPDLVGLGFECAQIYEDILLPKNLLDWSKEEARQRAHFRQRKAALPSKYRSRVGGPAKDKADEVVAFSRLTLSGQLEVLDLPLPQSWAACLPLNPHLAEWCTGAAAGELAVPKPNPPVAPEARAAATTPISDLNRRARLEAVAGAAALALQEDFITQSLAGDPGFPILGDADE